MGEGTGSVVPPTEHLKKLGLPDWAIPDRPNGKPVTLYVQDNDEPSAVHYSDLRQSGFKDCFFIGGLAAIIKSHPNPQAFLEEIIKDNGNGTYTVTFFDRDEDGTRTQRTVVVNSDFALETTKSDEPSEKWPTVIEKAYIKAYGTGGTIKEGNPGVAMEHVTGLESMHIPLGVKPYQPESLGLPPPTKLTVEALAAYREKGYATTLTTYQSAGESAYPRAYEQNLYQQKIIANHTYYVTNVDVATRTVTVHNPWDSRDHIKIPFDDLERVFTSAQVNPVTYDPTAAKAANLPPYPKRD